MRRRFSMGCRLARSDAGVCNCMAAQAILNLLMPCRNWISGQTKSSHVLKALGQTDERARSTVRFGLGRFTTETEVEAAADQVVRAVRELRLAAPV